MNRRPFPQSLLLLYVVWSAALSFSFILDWTTGRVPLMPEGESRLNSIGLREDSGRRRLFPSFRARTFRRDTFCTSLNARKLPKFRLP